MYENGKAAPRQNGVTSAIWQEDGPITVGRDATLPERSTTEVVVVGAGIAGLTTAYLLARRGVAVVVLERAEIGEGETGRTSAHLASALDDGFPWLEKTHGPEGARLAVQSHAEAIDTIEEIARREHIDCDFRRVDGYLHLDPTHDADDLRAERDAALRAGLEVEWLDVAAGPRLAAGPVLRFPRQAQFHPRRYLAGLVRAIERLGGQIYARVEVTKLHGGKPCRVETADGRVVEARSLVVATNVPINDRVVIHTKQAAYRSYVIAMRIPAGTLPPALHWDMAEPYHYVRLARGKDGSELLIVGGADHRTGEEGHDAKGRWDHLESWTRERFPMVNEVVDRWSGQILEPADGLAYIGRNPSDAPDVYVATGDSGHGLTHGTIAGTMIDAMIAGEISPYEELYSPSRLSRSPGEWMKENWVTAKHYGDWMARGDVPSEEKIPRGEGAVVLARGRRLAVYRDELGRVHRFSATCQHLGGIVHWNAAEKTWDCPCHGARYDRAGHVVNGPACCDLERMPEPEVSDTPASATAR